MIKNVLNNTKGNSKAKSEDSRKGAKKIWEEFEEKNKTLADNFRKNYHLRPVDSGITIISTNRTHPMRGITVKIPTLRDALFYLANKEPKNVKFKTDKDGEILSFKTKKNTTKDGQRIEKRDKEEAFQAQFINDIIKNGKAMAKMCNIEDVDELFFIASEFILYEKNDTKRERVDVIASNGKGKLIFFELKSKKDPKTEPNDDGIKQAIRYMNYYKNNSYFIELIKHYPICNVNPVDFVAYTVWGDEYNENSYYYARENSKITCHEKKGVDYANKNP